ncbi:hypothetical protein A2164_01960 [Candidatus Curtissbacteria bacterium RBG_13_35_7]|uniref:dTDP-4-dehydrorhamnose reductase n=1 Tax=Candidatus Curtissbacteria bacterium RBG_13_35_7 TaxID=1797705 RepID=A0A1F5G1Q1_9BACT|nr:MAG: hypothetical protein A2164_01960 [Candidatus Curtissbacteria bacterium RBG_13_35_7]
MKTTIGIIGSQSMVGSQVCTLLSKTKTFELVKADLIADIKVDITDKKSVESFFKNYNFEWLILFSAYTDVNGAEKQRDDKTGSCYRINVLGSANIANACKIRSCKLIFISTDYVFDGSKGPYSESAPSGPNIQKVGWYGITKIKAEYYIQKTLPQSDFIILRIAYPYSGIDTGKDDLVLRITKLYKKGTLYPMYTDQIITPTFIPDIAEAIKLLILNKQHGIFHVASPITTTQYQFAKELLKILKGKDVKIQTSQLKKLKSDPNISPRPVNGGLKVEKIQQLGLSPINWKDGIKQIPKEIIN